MNNLKEEIKNLIFEAKGKEKNQCHNPAGSKEGGRFCGGGIRTPLGYMDIGYLPKLNKHDRALIALAKTVKNKIELRSKVYHINKYKKHAEKSTLSLDGIARLGGIRPILTKRGKEIIIRNKAKLRKKFRGGV